MRVRHHRKSYSRSLKPFTHVEIVLHHPTGVLYLACSTRASRRHWIPALGVLEEDKITFDDYIATYDPTTDTVTRLTFEGFPTPQGYSAHGMDVVPSASDPRELYVYAINHRKPVQGPGKHVGADSVVEIFKTKIGGNTLTHVKTVGDPVIDTPNDVVGSSDGRSFYFTNDHGAKVGVVSGPNWRRHFYRHCLSLVQSRFLEFLGLSRTSVGYCHIDDGCKIAIDGLHGSNGIARALDGTVYVANSKFGEIRALEEQSDHSLVLTDVIALGAYHGICGRLIRLITSADRLVDNLSIDENGALWGAAIPSALRFLSAYNDFEKVAPSSALQITKNVGEKAFFGEKFKVEKVRHRPLKQKELRVNR